MNQILYIESNKKERGNTKAKIFIAIIAICVITIIAFLIGMISFTITNHKNENTSDPVFIVTPSGNELDVLIKHDKPIEKIAYRWKDEQETVIPGDGKQEIKLTLDVPAGTNRLSIKVTDNTGKTVNFGELYTGVEGDAKKPEIEFTVEGQKIKIIAKDETALDHIVYSWNDEDGTRVDATSENTKQIEESVDILKGDNTLKVKATDKAGNVKETEQTYRGSKRPKISVTPEGTNLVIKVSDEQGIQKIEYNLNGTQYSSDAQNTGAPLGRTEIEFKQPLAEGKNKIYITVYNVDKLEAEYSWEGTSNQ